MLYIIRRTLGFKKTADAISLKEFRFGITTKKGEQLDEGCGLKNFTTISKALKSLEKMGCIESDKKETSEGEPPKNVEYRKIVDISARPIVKLDILLSHCKEPQYKTILSLYATKYA